MFQNAKLAKKWWKFIKPNKKIYFLTLSTVAMHRVCLVIVPVIAAAVISNLIALNYGRATTFLCIGLGISIARTLFLHINYMLYERLIRDPYLRLKQMVADKIFTSRPSDFKSASKSYIVNMYHGDIASACDVQDLTCTKIADLIQVIMTVGALFLLNSTIAFIIIGVCFVNFIILDFINKRLATATRKRRDAIDAEYESISSVYDAKDKIIFEDTKSLFKKQLQQKSLKFLQAVRTDLRAKSLLNNWYWLIYTTTIFVITFFLINLVEQDSMELETYLVVTPYLVLIIEATNQFLSVFKDIRNANVYINRITKVMQFADKPMLQFGNAESDFADKGIDFIDVTASYANTPTITDVSFTISSNSITLIRGDANSGKRTIFLLLAREITAKKGQVLIDNENIMIFSKRGYEKHLTLITSKPFYINGSVMINLKRFAKNTQKIYDVCSSIGIHDTIMSLPKQYNTNISTLPVSLRYMIDFARCLLADCEVILFYETPDMLKSDEKANLKEFLKHYSAHKTIVFFSRSQDWCDISNTIIEIENGKIKNIERR